MMPETNFIDLNLITVLILFLVGFIGGMVSGFIGSGGAFVLTPAMMSFGAPAIVAVASNLTHKFPKALVGSIKRARYGQVDIKLGLVMGIFAEIGIYAGKEMMIHIRSLYGNTGTDLYVSFVFVVVLSLVGGFVLRDAYKSRRHCNQAGDDPSAQPSIPGIARWIQSVHIPGTMMRFRAINDKPVSLLFIAPMGFATGVLAATIAVGGFIGVPAMIYLLGVPAIMATATELVVAFVMGLGGSLMYAWDGFVDIRLAMIILAGSLFGVQIGAIGTTYVKEHTVKFVMAMIMLIVLVSRLFNIPVYLSELAVIDALSPATREILLDLSFAILVLALISGAVAILAALVKGMSEHQRYLSGLYKET